MQGRAPVARAVVDVGTLHGYREAMRLLAGSPAGTREPGLATLQA